MSSHRSSGEPLRVGRPPGEQAPAPRANVAIGFGSPSQETGVTRLDLNDLLVRHAQATYLMRIAGEAMREAGIDSGDIVLVDRAIPPAHGHIVIAVIDDEFVCRRFVRRGHGVTLQAASPGHPDIVPRDGQEFQIWGVVTNAIKPMPV
ncbi:LexA family protein [Ideonella sp. YS5]|uniref:LexA family protein n=1 Tax=Ideonella sp. YS5 TaxID=3453714 RepID=UPI003EEFAE75